MLTPAHTDLERIEQKLDLIIKAFGLDGNKNHGDIVRDAKQTVVELRDRQLTKAKKKSIQGACP